MNENRPAPILLKPDDIVNVDTAAHSVGRSPKTIRRWFGDHKIGRQSAPNATLQISLPAAHMVASGDLDALELLRTGERHHPSVKRYLDFLGLPA
ncbi:hypothetical protein IHQ71_04380 [Rhizobium sp. TH2]|uniref:hypothetical protein n=1 Tax=Rhizobium sp. TH2 TaxID=2775403 RepID=UPI0021581C28|nr:hypothetical protein [Rhizobium sp. TH2]UVC09857.1 hypothetical protein IHQ71_04380 [Rhizobium sp. TH2]